MTIDVPALRESRPHPLTSGNAEEKGSTHNMWES